MIQCAVTVTQTQQHYLAAILEAMTETIAKNATGKGGLRRRAICSGDCAILLTT